jgi:hypothetical protein
MESLNDLKQSSMEAKNKLSEDLERTERQNKELEYCRQIYEQELQNVKQTSANWEETLQAKLRQLQSEKEQVLQEYAEYKQHRKNKTTELKKQFAEKVEELTLEKGKVMRRYEEVVR